MWRGLCSAVDVVILFNAVMRDLVASSMHDQVMLPERTSMLCLVASANFFGFRVGLGDPWSFLALADRCVPWMHPIELRCRRCIWPARSMTWPLDSRSLGWVDPLESVAGGLVTALPVGRRSPSSQRVHLHLRWPSNDAR